MPGRALPPLAAARRPLRYAAIGGVCALGNNLILIVGDRLGLHYGWLMLIAFTLVSPAAYLLQSAITFERRPSLAGFLRFASGLVGAFMLTGALLAILCSGLHVPVAIAAPIVTVLLFVWNYAAAHWAILGLKRG